MISPLLKVIIQPYLTEATPFLFGKMLQPIYLKHEPKMPGTVFLLTQVHSDGFGDYFALLKAAWALRKSHPSLSFELVFTYSRPLPEVDTQNLTLHPFLEHPDKPLLESILEGKPSNDISAESILGEALYERMKKSLAIVHIALALNTFDNPLLAPKSIYFSEAGNFQGFKNCEKYNWYSIGLGPLEEGIFLDPRGAPQENHQRYFGYIQKNPKQAKTFENLVRLLEPGKKVEIIHPTIPIPYEEFQNLMQNSGPVVGCTGDSSLAECLALGKIPYYEFREHKAETLKAFIRLSRFLGLADIRDYFTVMADKEGEPSQQLYEILTRPTFSSSWKQIIDYIHTWCRLEDSLTARLRRILFQTQDLETHLSSQIIAQKLTFEEAYSLFESELKNKFTS